MPQFLIRVEGFNLTNVIDDTDQLSVRRGGGLMVLNAVLKLKESLSPELQDRLTEIATAASIGLFEFEAAGEVDALKVRDAVAGHLRDGHLVYDTAKGESAKLPLKHGTFAVNVVPIE